MFFRYEIFQNAPKATKKSMLVGLLTSWMTLALVVVLLGGIIGAVVKDGLGIEEGNYGIGFTLGIVAAFFIKRWGKKRMIKIRQMADEEAKRYSEMSASELREEEEQEEKKIQKSSNIFLAIFFFAIAGFFLFLSLFTMKPGYINVSEISGADVKCGEVYFVEDLRVEKAYYSITFLQDMSLSETRYYVASFTDKDGKKYMVNLDSGMYHRIKSDLSEDGEHLLEEVVFSGYFESEEIWTDIMDNYDEVSVDDNTEKINASFNLICDAEDNFFMTANKANLILFGIVAIFALLGAFYIMKIKKQNK